MRTAAPAALALLAAVVAGCDRLPGGAAPPASSTAAEKDAGEQALEILAARDPYPIPQDPAKAARLRAAYLDWHRDATVRAFDRVGNTSAPWAAAARAAMEARAAEQATWLLTGATDHALLGAADEAVRAARTAGCDDPLIRYWEHAINVELGRFAAAEILPRYAAAVRAVAASRYPDACKLHAVHGLLKAMDEAGAKHPMWAEEPAWRKQFWELFDRVAAKRDPVADAGLIVIARLEYTFGADGRGGLKHHQDVARHLRQAGASPAVGLVARGEFMIAYAWLARGSGAADTVTKDGWRLFRERLETAREALEGAWKADPSRWEAAVGMITVCLGLNRPRPEMEAWFARAMGANPDCYDACLRKSQYLQPKWHGSADEFLAFAWKCVRTGNWAGHLPAAPVRYEVGENNVLGRRLRGREAPLRAHYADPREWAMVRAALAGQLEVRPTDRYYRALYARLACLAGRYGEAREQFADPWCGPYHDVFADRADFDAFRREAEAAPK